MGLDVYLYKYENKSETDRLEQEYQTVSKANWNEAGNYETMTQEQKDLVSAKNKSFAKSLGLSDYGSDDKNKVKIEMDSPLDKEHIFKIGYFRSSYNGSGINRVLSNLNVPDLHEIFEPNDEYCFQPNWETALEKSNKSISVLEKKDNYRCFNVSPSIFRQSECTSEKQAIEIFMEELNKEDDTSFENYSTYKGHFYHKEPLKVLALISGTGSTLKKEVPCTYVIIEGENSWYLTALKIVKETIEYVLSQPDKEKYYLHWSS